MTVTVEGIVTVHDNGSGNKSDSGNDSENGSDTVTITDIDNNI